MPFMFTIALLLVGGLVALTVGAEFLVRGASRLAALARVSSLVIGLTVVAFGTSAPELVVSVKTAFAGNSEIALGNVVGSNIFNVLFILGVSALIVPLTVQTQLLRFDVPLLIGVSILTGIVGFDGRIGAIDGVILFSGLIAYTVWSIHSSRKESAAVQAEFDQEYSAQAMDGNDGPLRRVVLPIVITVLGLLLLGFGADWFVRGAIKVAELLGMSDRVIGLTIVAVGTSMPEVFTSVVAAIKGERDIAVGNVIGSNIFNILCVLGVSSIVSSVMGFGGIEVTEKALRFDLVVMTFVAVACLPIFFTGHVISRWEGALFLAYEVIYMWWMVVVEIKHPSLNSLKWAVLAFALPLTVLILLGDVVRYAWRGRNQLKQPRNPPAPD